jgi:thymidylate synthase (FAD)
MSDATVKKLQTANVPPPNHVKVLGGQGWIGLLDHMGTETTAVNAARVSFGKIRGEMNERDVQLLEYLVSNRHTSPLEHIVFTFSVHCPLFIRSQWHRHRTWSYNEISRRYTEEEIECYVPDKVRAQSADNRQASFESDKLDQAACTGLITEQNRTAVALYEKLLAMGVCREQARGVLPQNLMTTFWATVDLHNLLHFLELRDSAHAQVEIAEYARAIKKLILPLVPNTARIMKW